jgi:hypothetical protein
MSRQTVQSLIDHLADLYRARIAPAGSGSLDVHTQTLVAPDCLTRAPWSIHSEFWRELCLGIGLPLKVVTVRCQMIIRLLATWVPALLIALSGVMKLSGNPKILEGMSTLGVGRYVPLLGVMELTFATLFVIPATFKLGFVLASCYFAGAIATELSHDALKVNPFIPIVLLWIGAFIRDRSVFF